MLILQVREEEVVEAMTAAEEEVATQEEGGIVAGATAKICRGTRV